MLMMTGPVVHTKNYDRIPMTDGLGQITAYVYWNRVSYRPKSGPIEQRRTRVDLIAFEQGGDEYAIEMMSGSPAVTIPF
jgi:hypothetical protein